MSRKTPEKKASQLPHLKARKTVLSKSSRKHPARTFLFSFWVRGMVLLNWGMEKIPTASPSADLYVVKFRTSGHEETSTFFHLQPFYFRKKRMVAAAWSSEKSLKFNGIPWRSNG